MNAIFTQRIPSLVKAVVLAPLMASLTVAVQAQTVDIVPAPDVQLSAQPTNDLLVERLQNKQPASLTSEVPTPGTTTTASAPLTQAPVVPPAVETSSDRIAQVLVDPGQPTIGGSSYVGVAGNIGLSDNGSTALGGGNFAIISKIGLTNTLSTRPSAVLGDNAVILIPVTYDFSFQPVGAFTDPLPIAPYVGGGVAISTGEDSTFGAVLTGGVDVPLTSQFTATAALNVAFVDSTDIGILIGVGYNFGGFGL
ncbi:hypothetical protein [Chroogloeocystis siderophila]|uniref:Outer membrane protein beta-barrel domain-containing protein n=1 Tax=Chroogloeocystis siderophila 5.2 s.c.1 TaxID=247279 RepID=A0A1U7HL38_9CHRO|nr:hypothetical protein [Chroogloeocystis siderophila]OKH24245.1 hypothetical protein NIES1031_15730 [Chroogloeocystis siderophila 5.2 s.c.1]